MTAWKSWRDIPFAFRIADYLVALKYYRARYHEEEVAEFWDVLDKCFHDVFAILHNRHAAEQTAAAASPTPKPSTSELKPVKTRP